MAALLRDLYEETDEALRGQYQRSLSFGDGLFDRWQRAERLGFGNGASIYNSALVFGEVTVGEGTWIGPYTLLDGSGGGLSIGAYCSISAGVQIYTHDTVLWSLSGGARDKRSAPVAIGDRTYIGSQCVVAAGASVGSQCVVAANSFVNSNVADRSIVGGTPAHELGRVVVSGDDFELVYHSPRTETDEA